MNKNHALSVEKSASACGETCFGNQARAGFLFENKKTDRKNSEIAGAFCGDLDHIPIPVVPVFRRSSPAFFITLHYSSHFLPIYEKKATFR